MRLERCLHQGRARCRCTMANDQKKLSDRAGASGSSQSRDVRDDRSSNVARLFTAVLCLDAILMCAGQKPINLGGVKRHDVYIAGFFPYGRHVPESHLGRGVMPSVKLAVDHINDSPTVLRNYRLHMWWNDTEVSTRLFIFPSFNKSSSNFSSEPKLIKAPETA